MNNKNSLFALIGAFVVLGLVFFQSRSVKQEKSETSFERVIRTGTIRCGYGIGPPELVKDPNTGKLFGYDYDVVNEMGKVLGLKVEWAEEVAWSAAEQGLKTGRYDMMCNGVWAYPPKTKVAVYSIPFVYHPLFPVVRADMAGPENRYDWLNDAKYRMVIFSGTIGNLVFENYFPKAKIFDAMSISDEGDAFMDIAMGKTDFSFTSVPAVELFQKQNPNKIKMLPVGIEVTNGAFLLPYDDWRMKMMVDKALQYLLDSGRVREIMTRHLGNDSRLWRHPASSYDGPQPTE